MKFGKVDHPENIDFTLPEDHPDTGKLLKASGKKNTFNVYVGCAKWNKKDLKGFYPRGTKDELEYYSRQFNSIELNATFYHMPSPEQVKKWKDKTPEGFKFFPKISQDISHYRRLSNVQNLVEDYCYAISNFEEKLGSVFLQLHDNFKPKDLEKVREFIAAFPSEIPLSVEVRNQDWFAKESVAEEFFHMLEENKANNILVDSAGRRDIMHMRMTTPTAFIRYVGANHESDYSRLDAWIKRIQQWKEEGLDNLCFFVHQNVEVESPLLASYFIEKLNKSLGTDLKIPNKDNSLF